MVDVLIPKMGMTMKDGTLVRWLVTSGQVVTKGQPVYELTTEKLEAEVEAETDGVLHHGVAEGTTLEPGGVVGWILAEGEAPPAVAPVSAAPAVTASASASMTTTAPAAAMSTSNGRIVASPNARRVARDLGLDLALVGGTGPGGRITSEDVEAAHANGVSTANAPQTPGRSDRTLASPVARRLAEDRGVDLSLVAGTGPGGRITKEDVLGFDPNAPVPILKPVPPIEPAGPPEPGPDPTRENVPLTGMRGVIAERMHASLTDMAQLSMTIEVRMDRAVALRSKLRRQWKTAGRAVPTYTDLAVRAVALGLRSHPVLNTTIENDAVVFLDEIHIGVAVALDNGLVVPVVRNTDRLPVSDIAVESARLADAARSGTLSLDEMAGGTFSVTSLGMFDIDVFTPVINPPNVAILGVGRIRDEVRWKGKGSKRRPVPTSQMTLSLTIDHRAVDGAPAAQFLQTVRDLLEAPMSLLS